ncbi:MAG: helix-turn-helix transcriptional regulator [Betaproteobacteria bacterium]|nr:helix-turn-helix transcriptional regulator [Betaproteobacteria bacterium]
MKPPHAKLQRSDCPISIALEALGDRWTLLIVRDLMFKERKTYKDFLQAEEKIASNVLAERLHRLEALGILSKRADPQDARRNVYRLTAMGLDLAPMMTELVLWSARHFKTGAPAEALQMMTEHRKQFLKQIREDWETGEIT